MRAVLGFVRPMHITLTRLQTYGYSLKRFNYAASDERAMNGERAVAENTASFL